MQSYHSSRDFHSDTGVGTAADVASAVAVAVHIVAESHGPETRIVGPVDGAVRTAAVVAEAVQIAD